MFDGVHDSRINRILDAVSRRWPKEAIDIKPGSEERLYDTFWRKAEEHATKYGFWPTFEPMEIGWDDPALDIYGDD